MPPFSVVLEASSDRVCPGQCVELNARVEGGVPGYAYAWSDVFPNVATRTVCPARATTYEVTVSDASGEGEFSNPDITTAVTIAIASAGECQGTNGTRELCRAAFMSTDDITNNWSDALGNQLDVSGAGDVVVAGSFRGEASFGTVNLTSAGLHDGFVTALDKNCQVRWARAVGGDGATTWLGASAVDAALNTYVSAQWVGTIELGAESLTSPGTIGLESSLLMKLDPNGDVVWARPFASRLASCETALPEGLVSGVRPIGCWAFCGVTDLEVDNDSNLVAVGCAATDADVGGLTPGGTNGQTVFAAKLDGDGRATWLRRIDNANFATALAVGPSGATLVRGWGGDVYPQETARDPLVTLGNLSIDLSTGWFGGEYLAVLNADGSEAWLEGTPGESVNDTWRWRSTGIASDRRGRLVRAREEAIEDDDGKLLLYAQHVDLLDASGEVVWTRQLTRGSSSYQTWLGGVTTDDDDNILWVGAFTMATDFDGVAVEPAGNIEMAVVKIDPDGNVRWVHSLGGDNDYAYGMGIKTDAEGNVFVAYASGGQGQTPQISVVKLAP